MLLTILGSSREPSASFLGGDRGADLMGLKWLNSLSMELLLPPLWFLSLVMVAGDSRRWQVAALNRKKCQ